MTNVLQFNIPPRVRPLKQRLSLLVDSFCNHRRSGDDVFWLKENAEILNILETTRTEVPENLWDVYGSFYDGIENRFAFFPQYYRFLLSILLDLEDLGFAGTKGEAMVDWAMKQDLAGGELSDLQRMEARRLMARRGFDPVAHDTDLENRLRRFIGSSRIFSVPNKKAAYELTHTVFYLSEYGRRDPSLEKGACDSLHFAGLMAYLEQNADLLAEICIAMHYAKIEPPKVWTDWLFHETLSFRLFDGDDVRVQDDYHEFLMCHWLQALSGGPAFDAAIPQGRVRFERSSGGLAPLREMSEYMLRHTDKRTGDWQKMRGPLENEISREAADVLSAAAQSSDRFEAFFEGFARAEHVGAVTCI